jgi:hypothetical protein
MFLYTVAKGDTAIGNKVSKDSAFINVNAIYDAQTTADQSTINSRGVHCTTS